MAFVEMKSPGKPCAPRSRIHDRISLWVASKQSSGDPRGVQVYIPTGVCMDIGWNPGDRVSLLIDVENRLAAVSRSDDGRCVISRPNKRQKNPSGVTFFALTPDDVRMLMRSSAALAPSITYDRENDRIVWRLPEVAGA